MCNYTYKFKQHQLAGAPCIYPHFYTEYSNEFPQTKILPIDSDGYCIFHSRKKNWKIENGFPEKFEELLKVTEGICKKYEPPKWAFNFSGFYFFLSDGPLKISNCEINYFLDFTFCEFVNGFTIEDALIKSIDLSNSCLQDTLIIKNVSFSANLYTSYSLFKNGFNILNCVFKGYTYFDNCTFKNENKKSTGDFKFKDSFSDYLNFEHSNFEADVLFEKTSFKSEVIFDKCLFSGEFHFNRNEVNGVMNFKEAIFNLGKNTNPLYRTVDFNKLKINKYGKLIFQGSEPFENMVQGELQINFEANPDGFISFENFNLNKIAPYAKSKLFELEKTGHVEIGKGCRKYYCQTDIFEIIAIRPDQLLILDLVKVFCNYFETQNHYNLGIEIVERKPDKIRYFFFTDEILSKNEFENQVKQNEYDLWQTFSNLSVYAGEQLKANLVEEKSTLIDLAAIFLKIRNRILALDYHEKQLKELVTAIAIDGRSVVEVNKFYGAILNANQSFYKELPNINIHPYKPQIIMENTNNFNAPIGNIQIGDKNTQNNFSAIESQYQGLFENCTIQNDQKLQLIEQIKDIKSEVDAEKKESKLKKFIKEWGPTLGETSGKIINALIK